MAHVATVCGQVWMVTHRNDVTAGVFPGSTTSLPKQRSGSPQALGTLGD